LDIDGVLQPLGSQKRFDHDMEKLREDLAAKFDNDEYLEMDRYDLAAVYYDWDPDAVERLRKLCIEQQAEIVISSDWRTYHPVSSARELLGRVRRGRASDQYRPVGDDPSARSRRSVLFRLSEIEQIGLGIDREPEAVEKTQITHEISPRPF